MRRWFGRKRWLRVVSEGADAGRGMMNMVATAAVGDMTLSLSTTEEHCSLR